MSKMLNVLIWAPSVELSTFATSHEEEGGGGGRDNSRHESVTRVINGGT